MKTKRRSTTLPRLQPLCEALLAAGLLLAGATVPVPGRTESLP